MRIFIEIPLTKYIESTGEDIAITLTEGQKADFIDKIVDEGIDGWAPDGIWFIEEAEAELMGRDLSRQEQKALEDPVNLVDIAKFILGIN